MLVSSGPLSVPTVTSSNDPTRAVQHLLLLLSDYTPSSVAAFKASASTSIFVEPLSSHTGTGLIIATWNDMCVPVQHLPTFHLIQHKEVL